MSDLRVAFRQYRRQPAFALTATVTLALAMIGPVMIAAAVSLLIGVALIAAWLPARRAARIDPILALKRE